MVVVVVVVVMAVLVAAAGTRDSEASLRFTEPRFARPITLTPGVVGAVFGSLARFWTPVDDAAVVAPRLDDVEGVGDDVVTIARHWLLRAVSCLRAVSATIGLRHDQIWQRYQC